MFCWGDQLLPVTPTGFPVIKTSHGEGRLCQENGSHNLCRGLCRYFAGKGMIVFTKTSKLGFCLLSGFHLLFLWMVLPKWLWILCGAFKELYVGNRVKGKMCCMQHFLLVFNILTKFIFSTKKKNILKCFIQGKDICCVIKVSTFHLQIGHSFGSDFNRKFPFGLSCLFVGFSSLKKKKKGKTKQLKKQAQFAGSGDWITVVLEAVCAGAEARRWKERTEASPAAKWMLTGQSLKHCPGSCSLTTSFSFSDVYASAVMNIYP